MAEIYIQNDGNIEVLMSASAVGSNSRGSTKSLVRRLDQLEENEEYNDETFQAIEKRLSALEGKKKK